MSDEVATAPPEPRSATAALALRSPLLPNIERLINRHGDVLGLASDVDFETSDTRMLVPTADGMLVISLLLFPLSVEVDGKHAEAMPQHQAHLTLRLDGTQSTALEIHHKLTVIVCEILAQVADFVAAVRWGDVLCEPGLFANEADRCHADGDVPFALWIQIQVATGRKGLSTGATRGLRAFGLKEVELRDAPMAPDELERFMRAMINDMITGSLNLSEGNTLSGPGGETVHVALRPSAKSEIGLVHELTLENAERSTREKPGWIRRLFEWR